MNLVDYSPENVEEGQLQSRLRLAQLLQQQSMEGPVYSNKAGMAKMLTQMLAGMEQGSAEKAQRELAAKRDADRKGEVDAIFAATRPQPGYLPDGAVKRDDDGNPMPGATAQAPDRMKLAMLLAKSSNPEMSRAGLALAMKGPETPESFTLKPGEKRFHGGQVVAEAPLAPKEPEKEPEAIRALKLQMKGAGVDPESPAGQAIFRQFLTKTTTHQPAASMTVNTGKKFGETLATNVAEQVAQSADAARGAVGTLGTVQRISAALDSGKVMAGPGTTPIMYLQQAIGAPSTAEGLVETRKVIQGLSQMTLDSRKSLKGQGQVSDFEGKLLAKAASGDIDNLTIPEIKTLLSTATRLANGAITQHKTYLEKIKSDPELKNLAPFYDIQAPGGATPTVDELLGKYGGGH